MDSNELKAKLEAIENRVKKMEKEGRILGAVQIAAIGLVFLFGISTLDDLFKKVKQ